MDKLNNLLAQSIVIVLFMAMLFSCQGRLDEVRQMDSKKFSPQTEEFDINLIYTDSGKVAAKLKGPKLLDFSNLDFPYREFPDGAKLDFFDDQNKKNTVVADYAIVYDVTGLVDMQGNVEIFTGDSTKLEANQLYWDQNENRKWVFTDQEYTIEMSDGTVNEGQGFDSDEKFNNFISRSNVGIHYVQDEEKEEQKNSKNDEE